MSKPRLECADCGHHIWDRNIKEYLEAVKRKRDEEFMERVVIIGGGVSGLLASYVVKRYGRRVKVIEEAKPGGDFLLGGLKYIHRTVRMEGLFNELSLPWSHYRVNGGIMLKGKVEPYPKCLQFMSKEEAMRIQEDHYRKTRKSEPGKFGSKAMNDPAAKVSRRAIRCDFEEMIKELAKRADIVKARVSFIESKRNRVKTFDGEFIYYDRLIVTIPLWIVHHIADFYVPQGMAMSLNILDVIPNRDRYARWDYIYTPYTPSSAVHRLSPSDHGYSIEINGDWAQQERATCNDLAFLFPDGFVVRGAKIGTKGHLLELVVKPDWPENVTPLGRFAQWDPRATTDVTLDNIHKMAKGWGWKKIPY